MYHCVYINKTRGERDSYCVDCFPYNTPLPYNYSSENVIIESHKLDHDLQNPAPQSPSSNIGDSQMVAIEKLSDMFSKVAANLHQIVNPSQQQLVIKSSIIPHKVCSTLTKNIPLEQPNSIEDDYKKSPRSFQWNVHMSPSDPHIIIPDIPVPPPRVCPAQPPRVDTGGPSSNLRSRCKKNTVPNFALAAQLLWFREANAVTH